MKRYCCRLDGQEKAGDVALVRWPAGSGLPKEPLESLGGIEAWQTAVLNAKEKAIDVALEACGSGVPTRSLEGFGKFEAWQTAGLNASKKVLMSP